MGEWGIKGFVGNLFWGVGGFNIFLEIPQAARSKSNLDFKPGPDPEAL
jgi:hypothetical protein